jgi:hypothetical protein
MGGSGGGGKRRSQAAPPQAQPLDVGAIMGAASAGASQQIKTQYEELIKNYPKLEELSLGTVQKLATNLGNQETRDAQSYIRRALALGEMDPDASMPTSIEQGLYDAGERDLALGRSLSPEQVRESQQAARAAFASRGLGTSLGSAAAEVLNRDAMASARERERQAFASQQNTMYMGNVMGRRGALADLYTAGAGNLIAADPYNRAVAPGLGLAGQQQGNQMQMSGQTFSSANQLAGMAALGNAQMQEGRYNAYMNNQAALQAARMSAGASRQAGMMGMFGGIGSGLISAGGAIGAAALLAPALSDKREKKDIKPLGKAGKVLGLTAYEYKYKGDDEKRVGFMAQDVQKVLPEAVTEVNYKGKKRLAIKPAVIGQALAEELMSAKAA